MQGSDKILRGDDAASAIRQGNPHPIAYTYEAAEHCPVCTARAHGVDPDTGFVPESARDSEGSPIGAVAPWDEVGTQGIYCDTCGGEIEPSARARADSAGYAAGKAAGSWVIDGNTTYETAREILRMLDEGDPAVYDSLPSSPLSGEWAGDPLPRDVLADVGVDEDDDGADDVLSAYEDGFSRGAEEELVRACRAMMPAEDELARVAALQSAPAVKIAGHSGIAWHVTGSAGPGMVSAVMVGDDSPHVVDIGDAEPIGEDDYCPSCGQLGCSWH